MAAWEKVDGTELSVYGLRLSKIAGNLDLPPYKKILEEHDHSAKMRVLDEQKIRITLLGKYSTLSEMGTKLEQFKTKLKVAPKLEWYFPKHGVIDNFSVKDGVSVTAYGRIAWVTITLYKTEL
jgi:hypothetical protein